MWDSKIHDSHSPNLYPHPSISSSDTRASLPFKIHFDQEPLVQSSGFAQMLSSPETLTDLMLRCLKIEGPLTVDFGEMEDKLDIHLLLIFEGDSIELADEAIKQLALNKLAFIIELSEHLQQDIEQISHKFSFQANDVQSIHLSFATADAHNNGKSPIFVTFALATGQEVKVIYKPRNMSLEKMVCDKEQGLFQQVNRALSIPILPTYGILDIGNHGYSEFLEGRVLCDENVTASVQYGDADECFMKINDMIKEADHYLFLLELREELKNSEKGRTLLENPQMILYTTFNKDPTIIKLAEQLKQLPFPLNNLLTSCELLSSPKKLSELSFFGDRDLEHLIQDYILFHTLNNIQAVDLHAANFILSQSTELLYPIDLECFNHSAFGANEILPLIKIVFEARLQELPHELVTKCDEALKDPLADFERKKNETPTRFLPVSTTILQELQGNRLRNESFMIEQNCFIINESIKDAGFQLVDDYYLLEREFIRSFDQFEIPYFILDHDELFINGKLLGRKITESKKEEKEKEQS